ncbi:hypothetical protein O181_034985 [Austropuccinia psidii MF-1]|uniref:Integrase catalytic domain-containing protein n=1 Tax=Austropuccinia psidii MF-1 TaxID=1389203 RepID=A0A9Q3D3Z2_9BASI|nr:hypothetical protein [Austropuccinia psidii MF-1]
MFSRLLACEVDNHDIPSQPSSILSQKENISTIHLPLSPNHAMTIENRKIKDKDGTDCNDLKAQILQWHFLFGNIELWQIPNLLGKSAPDFLCLTKHEIHDCVHCILAKSLRKSPLSSTNRSLGSLELVVSDLMGPIDIATMNRGRYKLNICDKSSMYRECHILANKSDTAVHLQDTIHCWQQLSLKRLKILQMDNGGEINNNVFDKWLWNEGIHHKRSLPFFHQQNGVAKR